MTTRPRRLVAAAVALIAAATLPVTPAAADSTCPIQRTSHAHEAFNRGSIYIEADGTATWSSSARGGDRTMHPLVVQVRAETESNGTTSLVLSGGPTGPDPVTVTGLTATVTVTAPDERTRTTTVLTPPSGSEPITIPPSDRHERLLTGRTTIRGEGSHSVTAVVGYTVTCEPVGPTFDFVDVPSGAFYAPAVHWMADRGITTGVGGGDRFAPHDPVSRAHAITFLHRLTDRGGPFADVPFADVPSSAYFSPSTRWARELGLTTGVGGTNLFEPHRDVTRAEFVTLLHRFAGSPNLGTTHGFRDGVPGYAARAVTWAKHHGITTGVGGDPFRFGPSLNVTRGEAATFLVRYATNPSARGSGAVQIRV